MSGFYPTTVLCKSIVVHFRGITIITIVLDTSLSVSFRSLSVYRKVKTFSPFITLKTFCVCLLGPGVSLVT